MSWFFDERLGRFESAAMCWRDRTLGYPELRERIALARTRLRSEGIGAGSVVALVGDLTPDTASLLLALIAERCIAVPLVPRGAGQEALLAAAEAEYVVRADEGTPTITRPGSAPTHPLLRELAAAGEPGLVVFSSGSTGKTKAVLHSFTRLLERYRTRRRARRVLTFLQFDHLGGIHTLFHTLANGGTVVTVEDRAPDAVCAAIARHRVELLPTSPTFLNMLLLSEAHLRHDLSSLELVTYGTEVMPASTLARLRAALPKVKLQQTYGLTEVYNFQSQSREPGSLWVRIGGDGFEHKVVDGRLWVRTAYAMLGYLDAPSPFTEDGWLDTQDRVLQDGAYLRILGRESDIINVGGEKVFPAEVEAVLAEMTGVRDATVYAHPSPVTGHIVAVRLVLDAPEDADAIRARVREHCARRLARWKIPIRVEVIAEPAIGERWKKVRPLVPA